MGGCHSCGRPYDESFADWTMCRDCAGKEMEELLGEPVYFDDLGIFWTARELKEAGGMEAINNIIKEGRTK